MQANAEQFKFWAFISYSHHDKNIARELANRIRAITVPVSHRHLISGNSARFEPLYIDEEETAANSRLSLEIQAALKNSFKLIVICSPFSANSEYVAEEIQYFKSIGRAHDILCVVASGIPNATESGKAYLESFSPSLRYSDAERTNKIPYTDLPLAANIGSGSPKEWEHVVAQLNAGLLGVSMGDLLRARSNRKARKLASAIGLGTAFAALAFFVAWGWFLPHESYSKNFVRKDGIWHEVDKIGAAEAKSRLQSYLFLRRGAFNHPAEVRTVNSFGACESGYINSITDDGFQFNCTNAEACAARFSYENGAIATEDVIDQYKNSIELVDYTKPSQSASSGTSGSVNAAKTHGVVLSAVVGCSRRQSNVNYIEIARSGQTEKYDQKVTFRAAGRNELLPNSRYAYGMEYQYDVAGRLLEKKFLGADGQHAANKSGYSTVRFAYDNSGELINESYFGADGRPVLNKSGIAGSRLSFDTRRRATLETYYGTDNLPAPDPRGIFGQRTSIDPTRRVYVVEYLNAAGALQADPNGVAVQEVSVDKAGHVNGRKWFDVRRQPAVDGACGCFQVKKILDVHGAVLEEKCFDAKNQPVLAFNGVHNTKSVHDAKGNLIDQSFWGVDHRPVFCKAVGAADIQSACPVHRVRNWFDSNGNRQRVRFFDPTNQLTVNSQQIAGWNSTFNSQNFEIRTDFVAPNGELGADHTGSFGTIFEYNELGQKTAITRLDEKGQRLNKDMFRFDSRGNIIRTEWYGPVDTLEGWTDGNAGWDRQFDVRGRIVKETYFGVDRNPTVGPNGAFGVVNRFDPLGREVQNIFLDGAGQPARNLEGYASMQSVRNALGHRTRVSFHDVLGELTLQKDGISGWSDTLSRRGDVLERRFFGRDGRPVVSSGGYHGYSTEYDSFANPVVVTYRDLDWKPEADREDNGVAILRREYDNRGDIIRERYFDKNSKPMAKAGGEFGTAYERDGRGRVVSETSLSDDGITPLKSAPASRVALIYNAVGQVSERRFYNSAGVLAEHTQAPIVRYQHDQFNREIGRSFFTRDGVPMLAPLSGRSTVRFAYNRRGQPIEEISLGLRGEPVNRRDVGWHRLISEYDATGKTLLRCYTASGKPIDKCKTD